MTTSFCCRLRSAITTSETYHTLHRIQRTDECSLTSLKTPKQTNITVTCSEWILLWVNFRNFCRNEQFLRTRRFRGTRESPLTKKLPSCHAWLLLRLTFHQEPILLTARQFVFALKSLGPHAIVWWDKSGESTKLPLVGGWGQMYSGILNGASYEATTAPYILTPACSPPRYREYLCPCSAKLAACRSNLTSQWS